VSDVPTRVTNVHQFSILHLAVRESRSRGRLRRRPGSTPLEPDDGVHVIPLLDTHVHFWDRSVADLSWPWLEEGFRSDRHRWTEASADRRGLDDPRYTSEEFRAETEGAGVCGVVHAHCATAADPSQETAWLDHMAEADGWPVAIIGRADLSAPDGAAMLGRHRRASERFRGARDMRGPAGLDVDACAPALDVAGDLGIAVELRTDPAGFGTLAGIADRWPGVTFVLSHAGLPLERTPHTRRVWTEAARVLARRPNWVCKISALCGGSDPNWTLESVRPWAEACVEVFGPERCMLGTNWPVDRLFGTYEGVVSVMREIFNRLSGPEQHRLFQGTATEVYGLSSHPAEQGDYRGTS
jgi:predicted TIM-barrel fold metal-dependent hydrolase